MTAERDQASVELQVPALKVLACLRRQIVSLSHLIHPSLGFRPPAFSRLYSFHTFLESNLQRRASNHQTLHVGAIAS